MLPQGVRAKYLKQLPPEFTDVKDSEVQGEASRWVAAGHGRLGNSRCRALQVPHSTCRFMSVGASAVPLGYFKRSTYTLHRYEPAPRETEADRANDRRSLQRRLDQRLFMLVKPKGGGWALMQRGGQGAGRRRLHLA